MTKIVILNIQLKNSYSQGDELCVNLIVQFHRSDSHNKQNLYIRSKQTKSTDEKNTN